jgi:hypothetical protein
MGSRLSMGSDTPFGSLPLSGSTSEMLARSRYWVQSSGWARSDGMLPTYYKARSRYLVQATQTALTCRWILSL